MSRCKIGTALVSVAVMLCSCTTVDISPSDARATIASQLSVDPETIVLQKPARFGVAAPGERFVPFQLGVYAQTKTGIALFHYNAKTGSLINVARYSVGDLDQVAIESWGLFNQWKEMQVFTGGRVIAIIFSKRSDAIASTIEETQPPFDALVLAGVKSGSAIGRIDPEEIASGILVPLPKH